MIERSASVKDGGRTKFISRLASSCCGGVGACTVQYDGAYGQTARNYINEKKKRKKGGGKSCSIVPVSSSRSVQVVVAHYD